MSSTPKDVGWRLRETGKAKVVRFEFRIPGPLVGYRASARAAFDPRYKAFKSEVRYRANVAGVPDSLLESDSAEVYVRIFWKKKARQDCSNTLKAIEDAIFKQDRRIAATHAIRTEHHGEEYADVSITVERGNL